MKKIALCSLIACLGVNVAEAGPDCLREFSPKNNNWMARSNEYLFPTEKDYMKAVNRGKVYECDNSECADGTYVEVKSGHYFDGKYRSYSAIYKCNAPKVGNDKWEKVNSAAGLTKCTKTRDKWGLVGADSDEYLYPTKEDYDAVTKSEYGLVYECDSNVCKQGTEVALNAGHYFGKKKINTKERYVCVTKGGGDYWQRIDGDNVGPDPTPDPKGCKENDGTVIAVGKSSNFTTCPESLRNTGASICHCQCVKGPTWKCDIDKCKGDSERIFHYNKDKTNSTGGKGTCEEKKNPTPSDCKAGRSTAEGKACCDLPKSVAKWENSKCNCVDKNTVFKIVNGKGQCVAGGNGEMSCSERYSSKEGVACCEAGGTWNIVTKTCSICPKYTEWKYNEQTSSWECVAANNNGEQTCRERYTDDEAIACCEAAGTWDEKTKACNCGDSKKWVYDNVQKKGLCVAGNAEPVVEEDCEYYFKGSVECANGNRYEIDSKIPITKEELGGKTCDEFKKLYATDVAKIMAIKEKICAGYFGGNVINPKLEEAKSTLSTFFSSAKSNANVWKDAEGKFNGARLASDLTAGVVLGTVGGVVSGVVIKKKQVEKGFDALHCTVGGQTIADWGDTFNVGLQGY
jgi:hypothetical protein